MNQQQQLENKIYWLSSCRGASRPKVGRDRALSHRSKVSGATKPRVVTVAV
jgi:hypothetical protein